MCAVFSMLKIIAEENLGYDRSPRSEWIYNQSGKDAFTFRNKWKEAVLVNVTSIKGVYHFGLVRSTILSFCSLHNMISLTVGIY